MDVRVSTVPKVVPRLFQMEADETNSPSCDPELRVDGLEIGALTVVSTYMNSYLWARRRMPRQRDSEL